MKYRIKQEVIEARQFRTNNEPYEDKNMDEIVGWIVNNGGKAKHDGTTIYLDTLLGEQESIVGDYIIRDSDGYFHIIQEDVFENKYELV